MRNTRAQGISMNVVILAAIAVMVLLLVGTFMSGGFKALTGKITQFIGGSTASNATEAGTQAGCNTICASWSAEGCKSGTTSYNKALKQCQEGATALTEDTLRTKCGCSLW